MRKVFNFISGFILGLSPLAVVAFLGIFINNSQPNIIGISICSIMLVPAIWLGLYILKKVQIMGPAAFLATNIATPELDDPDESETKNSIDKKS